MKRQSLFFALAVVGGVTPVFGDYTLNTLVTFDGANGSYPYASLTFYGGNLYGTTFSGGTGTYGTVFEVTAGTNALSAPASFNQNNGSNPEAGVIFDSLGNLYGTTYEGGSTGGGTVFEVAAGTNVPTPLATFPLTVPYPVNGTNPQSVLISDGTGNLYGTTAFGGVNNNGTVFEVPSGGGSIITLATFNGTNGQKPVAGVISSGGNLYGTTQDGGTNHDGIIFKVNPGTQNLSTVVTFTGISNGANPNAGLISDAAGNMYGTTTFGGANNDGTVFELPANGNAVITLGAFNNTNGANPFGSLLLAGGNLYGTTKNGGSNGDGTVFEITAGGGTINTLATFNASNGANPIAGLIADSVGNLYGTTWMGGNLALNSGNGQGTVFELSPQSAAATSNHGAVSSGANQSTGVVGGTTGGIAATFTSTTGGTFNVNYDSSLSLTDLLNGSQGIHATLPTFALPTGLTAQAWDVSLTGGSFSGEAELVFHYDPGTIAAGIDPSTLRIYHFDTSLDEWVLPSGEIVNTTADTITLDTTSFSPFALGVAAVPEPASLAVLGLGALGLMARRRRIARVGT